MSDIEKEDLNFNVGYRLKIAREEKELKGYSVARKLGVTNAYISQMENGKRSVSLENLLKFSQLYDKEVVYFLQDFVG
jgi:transcriptional regulator with XRE-family HTH domain